MEIVTGEQVSSNFFHSNLVLIFLNSNRHKISFFNARGFKLGHFDVFDMLFPFLASLKSRSRDDLAAKALYWSCIFVGNRRNLKWKQELLEN